MTQQIILQQGHVAVPSRGRSALEKLIRSEWWGRFGPIKESVPLPEDISDGDLRLVEVSERLSKEGFRGQTRVWGGPGYEHINDHVGIYSAVLGSLGMPADPILLCGILLHDYVETHPELRQHVERLESSPNMGRRSNARAIRKARREIFDGLISELSSSYQPMNHAERRNFGHDWASVVDIVYLLTRFSEQYPFAASMYFLHKAKGPGFFRHIRKIEVPHLEPIDGRGHDDDPEREGLENVLRAIIVKHLDVIALKRETKPRYTQQQIAELEYFFRNVPMLRDTYGSQVNFKGAGTPLSYNSNLLLRGVIVTNRLHDFLNRNEDEIARGRQKDGVSYDLLQVLLQLREVHIDEAVALAETTTTRYSRKINHHPDKEYQNQAGWALLGSRMKLRKLLEEDPDYSSSIVADGPIMRCFRRASRGSEWARYDRDIKDMTAIMTDTDALRALFSEFYRQRRGDGSFFTLSNLGKWGPLGVDRPYEFPNTPPSF